MLMVNGPLLIARGPGAPSRFVQLDSLEVSNLLWKMPVNVSRSERRLDNMKLCDLVD